MSKMLDLPFDIWSSLSPAGLVWKKTLSTENEVYRIVVDHINRNYTLAIKHDGKQFRVIEASKGFPKSQIRNLDWRFDMNNIIKEQLSKEGS